MKKGIEPTMKTDNRYINAWVTVASSRSAMAAVLWWCCAGVMAMLIEPEMPLLLNAAFGVAALMMAATGTAITWYGRSWVE